LPTDTGDMFFKGSRLALGPTQPPVQWVHRALSPRTKVARVWSWPTSVWCQA